MSISKRFLKSRRLKLHKAHQSTRQSYLVVENQRPDNENPPITESDPIRATPLPLRYLNLQTSVQAVNAWSSPQASNAVLRQTRLKLQLKSHFQHWGLFPAGTTVYSKPGRTPWLQQLPFDTLRSQALLLNELLDQALVVQHDQPSLESLSAV